MGDISDKTTVKNAERDEKTLRRQELNDIRTVLASISGRRLMWRLLSKCNTFSSTYSKEASHMSFLAGKQDLGHFMMSEIVQADENLLLKLMKDNYKSKETQ